jgi:hypothetical protein
LYVVDLIISIDTYALMARCLTGEAPHEDMVRLTDLLASHPHLKTEYEHFRMLFPEPCNGTAVNGALPANHLQERLDRLNQRLKEEGAV